MALGRRTFLPGGFLVIALVGSFSLMSGNLWSAWVGRGRGGKCVGRVMGLGKPQKKVPHTMLGFPLVFLSFRTSRLDLMAILAHFIKGADGI